MAPTPVFDEFSALLLSEQLAVLDRSLGAGEAAEPLLELCAGLRDHAPLAHLCRKLLELGWLEAAEHQRWFAGFLVGQPETAVHKVLKALVAPRAGGCRAARWDAVVSRTLIEALLVVPLARLSSMCLVDRALKVNFTDDHDRYVQALVLACSRALGAGKVDEVTVDRLAQVPASSMDVLVDAAAQAGPEVIEAFQRRCAELARDAIAVLGDAPKAVSQSNAEELLSRRVYTDPGHFLIELLQNAEDAGATTWRLAFEDRRIVVWHDGVPFDAKDLVGVTSIGQTTKRKQQIGFFGVGFKSIYEVTDRPQVYSGDYRFEIADVSIPRALGARPPDLPQEGTVLVLPLRDPKDAERSPVALFEKARALDPVVLFTLRDVDIIEAELTEAAGGPRRFAIYESVASEAGHALITQEPDGWQRAYLVQDDTYHYDGGLREPGKPEQTKVMVGVRLDEDLVPRPLEPEAATVYSYLPTEEHSGLAFFVQGHFDLPVDRERITPESSWNRWILSKVPLQMARLAERAVSQAGDRERRARVARGLLGVLPLDRELSAPHFKRITAGLPRAFADVEILPGLDGELHKTAETLIAPPGLAALLSGEPRVETAEGRRYLLDPRVEERERAVARSLGARDFTVAELIALLEARLGDLPDGARPTDPALPRVLREPTAEGMSAFYAVLQGELEAVERTKGRLAAEQLLGRLRVLPLVLDDQGGLRRARPEAGQGPSRGDLSIRAVFEGLASFVHLELDVPPACDDCAPPHLASAFLDWLGVPRLDIRDVVRALEGSLKAVESGALPGPEAVPFPGSQARLDLVLELVSEAPYALQARVARLPLFPATDGRLYPVARSAHDRAGVLAVPPGPLGERLREFYGALRPVAAERAAEGPIALILARTNAPALSFETLIVDLQATPPLFDLQSLEALRALHALLEAVRPDIPVRARETLARLSIWPDRAGAVHPLRGHEAVLAPGAEGVEALFPDAPFLDPEVRGRAHLDDMGAATVGPAEVVEALSDTAAPPLALPSTPAAIEAALRFLLAQGDRLPARSRERLAALPAFLSDTGEVCRLAQLSRPDSPALRALYRGPAARRFLDAESLSGQIIARLELGARVPVADAAALVDDLAALAGELAGRTAPRPPAPPRLPLVGDRDGVDAVLGYLAGEARRLPRALVDRALELAIFPDAHGRLARLHRLGDDGAPPGEGAVVPCLDDFRSVLEAGGLALLEAGAQHLVQSLLDAGRVRSAGLDELLRLLDDLVPVEPGDARAPLQVDDVLVGVQTLLAGHAEALRQRGPSRDLSSLAIWRTEAGAIVAARDLIEPGAALDPLEAAGQETAERRALDGARLDAEAEARLRALGALVERRSAASFLGELVGRLARPGLTLEHQRDFLATAERVAAVAAVLLDDGASESAPLVDALDRLRIGGLRRADRETVELVRGTPLAADLLSPAFAARLGPDRLGAIERLPECEVIASLAAPAAGASSDGPHPVLRDHARRRQLYDWLVAREKEVFADTECRVQLRASPLFPTTRGTLAAPGALVLDPALPDLGLDWKPGPEVPAGVIDLLSRHLGLGQPRLEDLLAVHLLPAYARAVEARDGDRAAALLGYLAARFADRTALEARAMLRGPGGGPLLVEAEDGSYRPPEELVVPRTEMAAQVDMVFTGPRRAILPRPSLARHSEESRELVVRLLRRLGAAGEPPLEALARAAEEPLDRDGALALAGLCGALFGSRRREAGGAAEAALARLRRAAWIVDRTGCLRRPRDLFLWTPELEALIGDFPELYPDELLPTLLGDELVESLGFCTVRDVGLDRVARHLEARASAGTHVPFRVYQWMEQGLSEGWLDGGALLREFDAEARADGGAGERRWICTDDGSYWSHRAVLGVPAVPLFGQRRGTWEKGLERCPRLCRLLGVPSEVTAEVVGGFLEEVGRDVAARGDRAVLDAEHALPRMLLACYAQLARAWRADPAAPRLPRSVPTILCTRIGPGESDDGTLCLVPAEEPTLLRSDTPTLEALFRGVGRFHLAARGQAETRTEVDAFYDEMGVRRLRDAYSLAIGESGADASAQRAAGLAALRGTLRALLAVLPRVRQQRALLGDEGWVANERLGRLVEAGALRAIAGLEVTYRLEGVGHVEVAAEAVWDPQRRELLLDADVVDRPATHATGLAAGILGCVYDGPNEEQLADIVEILLPLGTREAMHAYLDRRHFPAGAGPASPQERLADRIDELLDYGLDERLAERFPELEGRDLGRWRERVLLEQAGRLLEGAAALDPETARRAVPVLLDAAGVTEPSTDLVVALADVLGAPSLGDVPAWLLSARRDSTHEAQPSLGEAAWPGVEASGPGPLASPGSQGPAPRQVSTDWSPPTLEALIASLEKAAERARAAGEAPAARAAPDGRLVPVDFELPAPPARIGTAPGLACTNEESDGLWSRFVRFLGLGGAGHGGAERERPSWADAGAANCFTPQTVIPPQLWATPEAREALAMTPPRAQLAYTPAKLPAPYRYAANVLGGAFDASDQTWSPAGAPDVAPLTIGEPSGQTVVFQGPVLPGMSQLPVPLYGRLRQPPAVIHPPEAAAQGVLEFLGVDGAGAVRVEVHGSAAVVVRYTVELLRVPTLSGADPEQVRRLGLPDALVTPTVALDDLPGPAVRWVEEQRIALNGGPPGRSLALEPWELALAAQDFVRRSYVYDDTFRHRREVQRALERLRPGQGNHHLALLHASRAGAEVLGRGICYELNTMVVELLRHLGVPAMPATGWLLDRGLVDRPDHLFALAVLPSASGVPCLLPLEASFGPAGPIRAVQPAAGDPHSNVSWGLQPLPPVQEIPGPWSVQHTVNAPGLEEQARAREALRRAELERLAEEEALLRRVIGLYCQVQERPAPEEIAALPTGDDPEAVEARLAELSRVAAGLLGAPALVGAAVALMRGELAAGFVELPQTVRELVRLGLAQVQMVPRHVVWPTDSRPPS